MDSTQPIGTGFEDKEAIKKKAILKWLTSADYSPLQSDFVSRWHRGTGQWLLKSVEFRKWTKKNHQTMFCPGIPGAGKTIITSIVVDELLSRLWMYESTGVAYIYFNYRRHDEQTPAHVLLSLLKQLSQQLPSLPQAVESLYYRHKHSNTIPSEDEISTALESVCFIYNRVFIAIDALDECRSDYYTILLQRITKVQIRTRANLFVTSRDIPAITRMFQSGISLTIRATDDDVRKYLDGCIDRLPASIQRRSDLQEEIKTEIVKSANGMYVACTFLSSKADYP